MTDKSSEPITAQDLAEIADRQSKWANLSFYLILSVIIFLYVVVPGLLSFFIKQPNVEQEISEGDMIFSLFLSQIPIIIVLLILSFAVLRDISVKDKFQFKNWKWIYLILPFGLELLLLPAIWLITYIFIFISEYLFNAPLDAGHLEVFLLECSDKTLIYMAVGAVIVAPIIEELVFRKIVYGFIKQYSSTVIATIFTSLLFAVVHCAVVKIPALFVIALFLQVLYIHYKSIYPSIILHVVHNGATFLILICIRTLMKDELMRSVIEQYM